MEISRLLLRLKDMIGKRIEFRKEQFVINDITYEKDTSTFLLETSNGKKGYEEADVLLLLEKALMIPDQPPARTENNGLSIIDPSFGSFIAEAKTDSNFMNNKLKGVMDDLSKPDGATPQNLAKAQQMSNLAQTITNILKLKLDILKEAKKTAGKK